MAEASSVGDRWLVTGATGFVGGALVRALAADGIEVHSVVRRPSEDPAVQALGVLTTPHQHDGSTEGLMAIVAAARPTVVAHLASNFIAEHRSDQVEPLVRDNVLFGAQLLEAMRASGVSRLINVGSAWQHYEDREFSPTCLYAATKQAFVSLLTYWVEAHGMRAVTIELTDTYGPGDTRRKLIPFMLAAERGGTTMAMVPASVPMDFVHVDDAVSAIRVAAARTQGATSPGHEIFAVRSGATQEVRALFAAWEAARGTAIAADWGARAVRAREMLDPWTQGVVLPGWSPRVSLEEGLRTL